MSTSLQTEQSTPDLPPPCSQKSGLFSEDPLLEEKSQEKMGSNWSESRRSKAVRQVIDKVRFDNDPNCTSVLIKPGYRFQENDILNLSMGFRHYSSHLKNLTLAGLRLSDEDGSYLAYGLEKSNIERLDVSGNDFKGRAVRQIMEAIATRNVLKYLWIEDQQYWVPDEWEMEYIVKRLKKNTSLLLICMDFPRNDPAVTRILRDLKWNTDDPFNRSMADGQDNRFITYG